MKNDTLHFERKWCTYETSDLDIAELLHDYLTDELIKHETSGCFNCIHFHIYIDDLNEFEQVNGFIDGIEEAKARFTKC